MGKKVFHVLSTLILIAGVSLFAYGLYLQTEPVFTPPSADLNAVQGVPVVPEELGWSEISNDDMPYLFSICGVCSLEDGEIPVWFYNDPDNQALLVLAVYGQDGSEIGRSGFLKPGEYLEQISVSGSIQAGDAIQYEIIGYSVDDYHSLGNVTLNTEVS